MCPPACVLQLPWRKVQGLAAQTEADPVERESAGPVPLPHLPAGRAWRLMKTSITGEGRNERIDCGNRATKLV